MVNKSEYKNKLIMTNDLFEILSKKKEVETTIRVNNQYVYMQFETPDYYLVSLNSDGTGKFKVDKPKPVKQEKNEDKIRN